MRKSPIVCLLLVINGVLPAAQNPDEVRPVRAVYADTPIQIDGILNEPVWQGPSAEGFFQSEPSDGESATEKSSVWIAFDTNSLYVAARLLDAQPDAIISRLGRRDDEVESDWFTFAVDPYYDRRSGFIFSVNPAGTILDGTLFNDEGRDMTWDGIWDYAVRVDEQGWAVEMQIPYNQLRFQEQETYTWGINFFRTIKRKNEKCSYVWVPKEDSGFVSRFAPLIGMRDIQPGRLVELLPYTLGRAHSSPVVPENPFQTGTTYAGNIGFDMRSKLKAHLTLNMTVNPDFGQVEVDPAVINISDQETYYAEKRPFFVDGADIFRFGYGGANMVRNLGWSDPSFFYSRRIGRSPQGYIPGGGLIDYPDWTTILGAGKITGKLGDGWNLGVMSALTQREFADVQQDGSRFQHEVEPISFYGVMRSLKEFGQGFSGIGIISTTVLRELNEPSLKSILPRQALALGLDGWTFLDRARTWVITGWMGTTQIKGSETAITRAQLSSLHYYQRPDIDYVSLDPDATSLSGWAGRIYLNKQKGSFVFNTAIGAMSPGFHAMDMGYHARGDMINAHVEAGYQIFHPGKMFRTWRLTLATYRGYDFGGMRTDENYVLNATAQLLSYWQGSFYLSYDPNRTSHYFTRGGPYAHYPWGIMRRLSLSSDTRRHIVLGLFGHYRTHPFGAYNYSFNVSLGWKPSDNLRLSIVPGYSWRHSVGQYISQIPDALKTETYGVHYVMSDIIQETASLELRVDWTFTPKLSLQAYLQPFIGVGDYFKYKELRAERTFEFDVFGEGASTIELENGIFTVDPDGPGPSSPFSFRNPDFNLKSLRGTIVLRWEYRPGSTLYAVWTQNRADTTHPGDFDFARDVPLLFQAPGDNIFLLKFNFRFTL
jgi:hypothetical protein